MTRSPRVSDRRLDGWPNRDLDVGKIVLLAPNLEPLAQAVGADVATVRKVLSAWGPGKYDAQLNQDGKGFRPDGKSAATVIPAAFGLAGVNLHTYTGWGSVTYWNAYVATTQMHGFGTFFDPRMKDAQQFPARREELLHSRPFSDDRVTPKLAALHFYQLAIPRPDAAQGFLQRGGRQAGRGGIRGKGEVRELSRSAALHRAGLVDAHRRGDRHRRLPGQPITRQEVLPHDAAPRVCSRAVHPVSTTMGGSRICKPW